MLVEEIDQIREIGKNIVSSLLKERRRERTRLALLLECDEEIVDEFLIDFHVKALQTDLREKRYELRQNCIIDHGAFELYWRSAVELAVFNDVSLKRLSRNYVDNKEEAATALEAMQYILPHFAQITKSIEVKELPKHENLSTKYQRWDNFNDDDDDDNSATMLDGRYCARHRFEFSGDDECPKCVAAKKKFSVSTDHVETIIAIARAAAAESGLLDASRLSLRDDLVLEARRLERQTNSPQLTAARNALERRLASDRRHNDVVHNLSHHIDSMPDDDVSIQSCLSAVKKATKYMPHEYGEIFKDALSAD
mmetsp:Transcript_10894/g.13606  ORF Transcript_10894/g.13606 Transcript_10894/m.13606 type:complete len:310 (+) Transcript_10894:92-1021(+)